MNSSFAELAFHERARKSEKDLWELASRYEARMMAVILIFILMMLSAKLTAIEILYTLTPIGDLPGGRFASHPIGMNAWGEVVGSSESTVNPLAFFWRDGQITEIGDFPGGNTISFAYDVNRSGHVVGLSYDRDAPRAFLWREGTAMIDLGRLSQYDNAEGATAINDSLQIVGTAQIRREPPDGPILSKAFLWESGTMRPIVSTIEDDSESACYDINNVGQVIGSYKQPTDTKYRSFLWDSGHLIEIPNLPGFERLNTASAINNLGQVVGASYDEEESRAFLWDSGVLINLSEQPGGAAVDGYPTDINDKGDVVGTVLTDGVQRAVLWRKRKLIDLNSVIPPDSGWLLTVANAINNAGQITGYAINSDGQDEGFFLNPLPVEPDALFSRSDANADGEYDISDAILVLLYLFRGTVSTTCTDALDANDSGQIDIADPIGLLNSLFLGGFPPPEPYPNCGSDPTEDDLSCEAHPSCE